MPSTQVLNEKKLIVEELTSKLKAQSGVFVNYSGITVNEDTELRVKMRAANVDYSVVKNTLMRFAVKNVGFEDLEPILKGTTSLAVSSDDPVAPARIVKEYADNLPDYFEIKGGFMDGRVLSVSEVNALASIPALPILQAQLLGTMLAPIASLAVVLKAISERGDSPAEAPVEEAAPVEAAAEAPAEAPVDEPAPAEAVAEAPAEAPVEEAAPAEAAAEAPAEEPAPKKSPSKAKAKPETQTEDAAQPEAQAEVPEQKKTASKAKPKTPPADSEEASGVSADDAQAAEPVKKPAARRAPAKPKAKASDETVPEDTASDIKDE